MTDGPARPDFALPGGAADLEATRTVTGARPRAGSAPAQDEAVQDEAGQDEAGQDETGPCPDPAAGGAAAETVRPRTATEVVRHGPGLTVTAGQGTVAAGCGTVTTGHDTVTTGQAGPASRQAGAGPLPLGIVRHGPGVPAAPPPNRVGLTAEHVWRDTRPARPFRRLARLRRMSGLALTAALLAASGVLLYLRFHHAPLRVTGVAITRQAASACGVDVTGQVTTNGSAGTVSYQWLLGSGAPQPLSQTVAAGQHTVDVTVAVQGQGQGSTTQRVTLQVLGPDPMTASAVMKISCPLAPATAGSRPPRRSNDRTARRHRPGWYSRRGGIACRSGRYPGTPSLRGSARADSAR